METASESPTYIKRSNINEHKTEKSTTSPTSSSYLSWIESVNSEYFGSAISNTPCKVLNLHGSTTKTKQATTLVLVPQTRKFCIFFTLFRNPYARVGTYAISFSYYRKRERMKFKYLSTFSKTAKNILKMACFVFISTPYI